MMSLAELVSGAIGTMLLAIGVASVVTWLARRPSLDRQLLFFGIWCCLYGARLVASQAFVRTTIGGPLVAWRFANAFVTYAINVPGGLFIESLIGTGWKQSIRRVWQVDAAYAVAGIGADLILRRPAASMGPNAFIVLAGLIVWIANLWHARSRLSPLFKTPAIAVGTAVLVLFVLNQNVGRPVVPSLNLEPIGVLVFTACLGYSVIANVMRQETELVAVRRELETARQIQKALLPRDVPHVVDVDLAVRYLPLAAVAGDLYDFAVLGPGRLGILVADVSGHGIPAALVASMVKVAFSAQSVHAGDPAAVLAAMNRILCSHMDRTYVTAIYAVIDVDRQTITYANAGHPPLFIVRRDRHVDTSNEHGFMLGLDAGSGYVNGCLGVHPGDGVLLCTDGVLEAQDSKGEFVDEERLKAWVAAERRDSATGVADAILRRLRAWRGVPAFDDDVTFVVARVADGRATA